MPIDPEILKLVVVLAITIPILCWAVNQLPSINTEFRGKVPALLIFIAAWLAIAAMLQWSLPENPTPQEIQTQIWLKRLEIPCYLAIVGSAVYLAAMSWRTGQNNSTQDDNTPQTITLQDWRNKLFQVMKKDVDTRLEDLLHNQEIIRLVMVDQREQVGRPPQINANPQKSSWVKQLRDNGILAVFQRGNNKAEEGQPIIDIFNNDDVHKRLLILGAPGAGKTTMLLELARDLLKETENNSEKPFPVLFELSNWKNDKQSFAEWLVSDLKDRYNIPLEVTQNWLETSQIIPLLDGLDELGLMQQKKCIAQLNKFLENNSFAAVVCCRYEEYLVGEEKLNELCGAVCLQELSNPQIQTYLAKLNRKKLWSEIKNDPDGFLALAKIPLLLHFIPVAFPDSIPSFPKGAANPDKETYYQQRRGQLFDAYIDRKLTEEHDQQGYTKEQTERYLRWLARRMKERKQTEFLVENMQPDMLKHNLVYQLIAGLISGLIVWLIFGLIVGLSGGLIGGVFYGLIVGLVSIKPNKVLDLSSQNFYSSFKHKLIITMASINPGEALDLSRKNLYFSLKQALVIGLIIGLTVGLIVEFSFGLIVGLIGGFIFGFIGGLYNTEIRTYSYPNQGIIELAKIAITIIIISYPGGFLISYLPFTVLGREANLNQVLIQGFAFALLFSLLCFTTLIQHYCLRLVLWRNGAIPWRYARFLTYAHNRKLLKQVGGRYRFFHDLLREHFAGLETQEK
jgi:F0F1-type ATP synthase assembly protein I